MNENNIEDRFAGLVQRYFEDELNEAEADDLSNLIATYGNDIGIREQLHDTLRMHFLLGQVYHETRKDFSSDIEESSKGSEWEPNDFFENIVQLAASSPAIERKPRRSAPSSETASKPALKPLDGADKRRRNVFATASLIFSTICIVALSAWYEFSPKSAPFAASAGRRPVAVVTDTASVPRADAAAFRFGEPIYGGGSLMVRSGHVELLLYNGSRIVLEGPADVSLLASDRLFCRSGKLSASVPASGIGLKIQTPHTTVEDLGTAFFLDVSANKSDVQVVDGHVRIIEEKKKPIHLKKGDAVKIDREKEKRRFQADFSGFITYEMMKRLSDSCSDNLERRKRASLTISSSKPGLRFDFREVDGEIRNMATSADFAKPHVIGCGFVPGRNEPGLSVRFAKKDDRIVVHAKTPLESATFSAWIAIDKLDSTTFHPILMSNRITSGGILWQIAPDGALNFGCYSKKSRNTKTYLSPIVFTPERLGKSFHIALVVDPARKNVAHYFDGKVVASLPFDEAGPIWLRNTLIGNWMPRNEPVGSLGGTIEGFRIYDRALNPDEVYNLSINNAQ